MIWAIMASGKANPLDPDALAGPPLAKQGHIVYNEKTGHGRAVTMANLTEATGWVASGATLHLSHWATCPERKSVRAAIDANCDRWIITRQPTAPATIDEAAR